MVILDTNVVSELMRSAPDRHVIAWLDRQPVSSVWITSVTLFEIQFGLEILPAGKRRSLLIEAFQTFVTDLIDRRIASFDAAGAEQAASLMSKRHKAGRPVDLRDTLIAGIALASRATLATRNISHFPDLSTPVVNPWVD